MPKRTHLLLITVVLLMASTFAVAQTSTSRILGRVVDAKQASVAGAAVTVTNEATGVSHTQTTTDSGVFAFDSLPAGNYTVMVEQTGFKKYQRTGNNLEVNTPLDIEVTLEIGQVSEVVTVTGGTEQLQTANATIGNVVEQKAIEALPLNGRNPLTLLLQEPGVVQRSAGAAGSGVHVNGARDRAYNVTIDGIEANESSVPNPVSNLYRLNPDNVQEFKVTTNNATAEEGRNSGASISVATRSGTNDFHGTVFYFNRNDAFNSNEFFSNALGQDKPVIKMHQFGFETGGPIKKNKTFFFGSYQVNRIGFTQPIDQTFGTPVVYTDLARQGIFRYFAGDPSCNPTTGTGNCFRISDTIITRNNRLLVDPFSGALKPQVPICANNSQFNCVRTYDVRSGTNNTQGRTFDPVTTGLIFVRPSPNNFGVAGDGLNTGAFLWNPPTQIRGPAIAVRVDHTFNENNSLFGRYLFSDYNTLKGDPLNGRPQVFPGDFPPLGEVYRRTSNLALSYRRVFSPRVVNELTAGYARFEFLFTQGEADPRFPDVPPFDFNTINEPYNNTPRTYRAVTTPQLVDNLSIVSGAHVLRTGFNMRFYRHVDQRGQPGGVNVTPTITFASGTRNPFITGSGATQVLNAGFRSAANINSTDNTTLGGLINNFFGMPSQVSQTFISNLKDDVFLPFKVGDQVTLFAEKHKLNQYNFYFQDEWKFRHNVTFNYGVRWEINPAATTVGGAVLRPTAPIQSGPVTFAPADTWYDVSKWGVFGPRLGLAYSPDFKSGLMRTLFGDSSKSVIRIGYGIAYDTISSFQVTAAAGRVPGLLVSCSSTWSTAAQAFGAATNGCITPSNVTISQGFPTLLPAPTRKPSEFLTLPAQTVGNSPPIAVFAPEMKIPTVHQWNLSVQRELPGGIVAQAAYIGRAGNRLFMAYDINQINVDKILPSYLLMQENFRRGCLPSGSGALSGFTCTNPIPASQIPLLAVAGVTPSIVDATGAQAEIDPLLNNIGAFSTRLENTPVAFLNLRLRPNPQFGRITYLDNSGASNYHAGQVTLRRRFASGLGLNLAYTFAKSIDNQSVDPVGAASGGGLSTTNSRTPRDNRNFREERGRSDFDRRHAFSVASVWELPVGRGRRFLGNSPGWINHTLGGWSINSIFNAMAGEPFSVRSGSFTSNGAHESNALVLDPNIRAQLQEVPGIIGPVVFANDDVFAVPPPGSNGSGRNIFTSAAYWNLDLSFIKVFRISERFRVQFRTEMFNVLNRTNFDNPRDASVGSPNIQSALFAQTCCAGVAPPSTQTIIQTGESARVIQFAMKVQF